MGGVGSTVTQPASRVCTSIHAEMSDPDSVTGAVAVAPAGATKPTTTRAGKPSCRAMSAAVTAYCSWSPTIGSSVRSCVIRSAP